MNLLICPDSYKDALPASDAETLRPDLEAAFGSFDGQKLAIDQLAIFVEPEAEAPFRVHSVHRFETLSS